MYLTGGSVQSTVLYRRAEKKARRARNSDFDHGGGNSDVGRFREWRCTSLGNYRKVPPHELRMPLELRIVESTWFPLVHDELIFINQDVQPLSKKQSGTQFFVSLAPGDAQSFCDFPFFPFMIFNSPTMVIATDVTSDFLLSRRFKIPFT